MTATNIANQVKFNPRASTNGKIIGITKLYHDNGQLRVALNFSKPDLQDDGEIISYHPNGVVAKRSNITNGLLNGDYKESLKYMLKTSSKERDYYYIHVAACNWLIGNESIAIDTYENLLKKNPKFKARQK